MTDAEQIYLDLVRYGHIFSGILWIGILYFYNFIQAIALPRMEASARPHYQTTILPFSLNVFRWAALSTLLFGLLFIISAEMGVGDLNAGGSYLVDTARGKSILIGGVLGRGQRIGHHHGHRLPHEAHPITGQRATPEVGVERETGLHLIHPDGVGGVHRGHAGVLGRRADVNTCYLAVGHRRAHEMGLEQPVRPQVAGVAAFAGQ